MVGMFKEITVVAKDRIGLLADVSEFLGRAGINIESISSDASNGTSITRLVTASASQARQVLEKAGGFKVVDANILVIKLRDRPGELANATRILSDNHINIHSAYLLGREGSESLVAMKTGNYAKSKKLLKNYL